MGFDQETKRMKVESIHPGITREDITKNTGFELLWDEELATSLPPAEEELRILRDEVDPMRYIIGREAS
jgi:glutaconate CoA-transferase subunit B